MKLTACWNKIEKVNPISPAAPSVPLCAWPGGHLAPYKDDFTTDQRSQETPGHTQDPQIVSSFTLLHSLRLFMYCKYFFHELVTLITKKNCGDAVFYIGDPNKIMSCFTCSTLSVWPWLCSLVHHWLTHLSDARQMILLSTQPKCSTRAVLEGAMWRSKCESTTKSHEVEKKEGEPTPPPWSCLLCYFLNHPLREVCVGCLQPGHEASASPRWNWLLNFALYSFW
jgi:hypothetical protein